VSFVANEKGSNFGCGCKEGCRWLLGRRGSAMMKLAAPIARAQHLISGTLVDACFWPEFVVSAGW
jgi:hypothetical protein